MNGMAVCLAALMTDMEKSLAMTGAFVIAMFCLAAMFVWWVVDRTVEQVPEARPTCIADNCDRYTDDQQDSPFCDDHNWSDFL